MKPVKVFLSYSKEDEKYKIRLDKHLKSLERENYIDSFNYGDIKAGEVWQEQLQRNLNKAEVILLLISVHSLANDYILDKQIANAINRTKKGQAIVIPILISSVYYEGTGLEEYKILPANKMPISEWTHQDKAYTEIVQELKKVINSLNFKQKKDARENKPKTNNYLIKCVLGIVVAITILFFGNNLCKLIDSDKTNQDISKKTNNDSDKTNVDTNKKIIKEIKNSLIASYSFNGDFREETKKIENIDGYPSTSVSCNYIDDVSIFNGKKVLKLQKDCKVKIPHNPKLNFETSEDFSISFFLKVLKLPIFKNASNEYPILQKSQLDNQGQGINHTILPNPFSIAIYKVNDENFNITAAQYGGEKLEKGTSRGVGGRFELKKWTHVAFMNKNDYIYLYINGKQVSKRKDKYNMPNAGLKLNSTSPISIGHGYYNNIKKDKYIEGEICNLKFFNSGLSEEAIRLLSKLPR